MAASASDLLQKVSIATATTLDAPGYTISDTSITVGSTSTWPTDTGITFAIDEVDANGDRVAGSYNEYVGTVASGTSVTNVTHVNGTDRNYAAGTTTRVYIPVSEERENRIVTWGLTHADQDGTLKAGAVDVAAVLANDVVTTAKILDDNVTAPKIVGIDKSNLTTDSNPYKFNVYRNAALSQASGAQLVTFDAENFDTNSSYGTGTGKFVVPVAGFYMFSGQVSIQAPTVTTNYVMLYVNGTEKYRGSHFNAYTGTVTNTLDIPNIIMSLAANDEVQIYTNLQNNPTAINVGTTPFNTFFSGYLVSRT